MINKAKKLIPLGVKDFLKGVQIRKVVGKLRISDKDLHTINNATFKDDGLITAHHSDFLNDPRFIEAYDHGRDPKMGYDMQWRAYICCWAAKEGLKLDGDFVECGVEIGVFSKTIMHYLDFNKLDKKFYLLDTFCGIPERFKHLAANGFADRYHDCYAEAVERFKCFNNAVFIKGVIPNTLAQVKSEKICYLSIDLACTEPEIEAIKHFWDKLSKGAVVILQDYNYSEDFIRQKEVFDNYTRGKGIEILALPTGQGIIIK